MQTLSKLFAIDLRALAVFRISLAVILLYDLLLRSLDLTAHYTSVGIAPASYIKQYHLLTGQWSLHLLVDTSLYQAALFALAATSYTFLLVGYRTKLFTITSWAMVVSLNNRNPIVDNAADYLIGALLMWLAFLPSGARFSIDSGRNKTFAQTKTVLSTAGAIILLQILLVYFEAGNAKNVITWLVDSSAVTGALSLELYTTQFGSFLGQTLTEPQEQFLSRTIYYGELLIPFVVMFPFGTGPIRTLLALLMGAAHLVLGLCMDLGAFGPLMASCWFLFLPSAVWDKFALWFICLKSPDEPVLYAMPKTITSAKGHSVFRVLANITLLLLFAYSTVLTLPQFEEWTIKPSEYSYSNTQQDRAILLPARVLALDHHWGVFPSPGDGFGRISIIGQFPGGSRMNLDVLGNCLADGAKQLETFRRFRWKKFFNNFLTRLKSGDPSIDTFGKLLCQNLSAKSPVSIELQYSQISQAPYWKGQTLSQSKIILCHN